MSKRPILKSLNKNGRLVNAVGGLNYLKGNKKPYFSLTIESWVRGREDCFGCAHEELAKLWPELKPLADLHLSDIDGVPVHAVENGWYWLAGAAGPRVGSAIDGGHLGQQYHGGNSKIQHWKEDGAFDGYRESTEAECLKIFAEHARCEISEAERLLRKIRSAHYDDAAAAKRHFAAWVEAQKPRWKAEAEKCIADLGLVVFGDKYEPEVSA